MATSRAAFDLLWRRVSDAFVAKDARLINVEQLT
jgi:hypothetical protein